MSSLRTRDSFCVTLALALVVVASVCCGQAAVTDQDSVKVVIVGEGSIRDILNSKSADIKSMATGSLAANIERGGKWNVTLRATVAQSPDTVTVYVGPTILNPARGAGFSFSGKLSLDQGMSRGIRGYLGASSVRWSDKADAIEATVAAAGLGGYLTIVDKSRGENEFSLAAHAGLGFRGITGDVADGGYDEFRRSLLNTTRKSFFGPELGINLVANFVTVSWLFTYYPSDGGNVTQGFSGGRHSLTLSVEAPIWRF